MEEGAPRKGVTIAIEGCCHGELDNIYATMQYLEQKQGKKIDLLISCGDFQAVRNLDDLECLACPPKYRALNTFHKYYSGEAVAPYPTLFIGGNHEASNHLWELFYGGWAAPNVRYLGHAGVVNFGGVRIAGLSGIYKGNHYRLGHYEMPPYNEDSMRSAYHIRQLDVYRLAQLRRPVDVFLSHDWPQGIAHHGDKQRLFQTKSFLRREVEDNSLGSPPAAFLMRQLHPSYWFAAHLHTKFAALYPHTALPASTQDGSSQLIGPKFTRFLALDKCLPRRDFLQVVEFPDAEGPKVFSYDEEWLSVLRNTHGFMSTTRQGPMLPAMEFRQHSASDSDLEWVRQRLEERGGAAVPNNFVQTAPIHVPGSSQRGAMPQHPVRNPQAVEFLEILDLDYNLVPGRNPGSGTTGNVVPNIVASNPEEIELGDDDGDDAPDDAEERINHGPSVGIFEQVAIHNYPAPGDTAAAGNGTQEMLAAISAVVAPNPEEIELGVEEDP